MPKSDRRHLQRALSPTSETAAISSRRRPRPQNTLPSCLVWHSLVPSRVRSASMCQPEPPRPWGVRESVWRVPESPSSLHFRLQMRTTTHLCAGMNSKESVAISRSTFALPLGSWACGRLQSLDVDRLNDDVELTQSRTSRSTPIPSSVSAKYAARDSRHPPISHGPSIAPEALLLDHGAPIGFSVLVGTTLPFSRHATCTRQKVDAWPLSAKIRRSDPPWNSEARYASAGVRILPPRVKSEPSAVASWPPIN